MPLACLLSSLSAVPHRLIRGSQVYVQHPEVTSLGPAWPVLTGVSFRALVCPSAVFSRFLSPSLLRLSASPFSCRFSSFPCLCVSGQAPTGRLPPAVRFPPSAVCCFPGAQPHSTLSATVAMAWRNSKTGKARSGPFSRPVATVATANRQPKRAGNALSGVPLPPTMGLPLQKKFGQHLLKNQAVLDKIVQAADIRSSDTVLEIGPGTGNLTMRLLPVAREVVALDVDARMVNEVKKRAISNGFMNLAVRHGDALRSDLGVFDVCAANLPYQISSHFLLRLLAHRPPFRCAVLMFQKEFGERLMAQPGDKNYCRLAANVSLFCTVQRVCKVDAKHFTPPPKVDSVVVKVVPRPNLIDVDFKEWDGLMRICFGRKNRTLHALFRRASILSMLEANYKTWCTLNKCAPTSQPFREFCLGVLSATGLGDRRSVTIDIDTYFSLLLAFNKKGIHFVNVANLPAGEKPGSGAPGNSMAGTDENFFYDDDEKDKGDDDEDM
ncbi:ribosomal RNA (adenine(1779)-N(6)/adenine(1780)-N(6))-dimethyltransferase, putative [Toxoplasma gondii ME49]|uniref:rRNA adenine N(6)-methyltransferase n=2 Tax=Toxoplasma gondii TaxID=5811 RepID=B6KH44_TOXGV|nr:ribosomal RNA (adenine(1779)-N(6)/adenine(1780)-N(6))-dimethyltransferase, putative [Toxoplasma gondii ME49]EPT24986.1 ribosomal RNA (adenine(1779)-N(6)/adenine(1780)-N(6))-dimethyltransferase, putative [Toxoplasma gondii ME49]ESS34307.1 putative ribosomal RNA (adenine(1779)-N(6)/adenine(1780)-N(6))-dimethyltransferase [Toxoplasma gondii VEG]CEL78449.1 TPA: dimethyladenosine transferase, putative [Toxoplasma gondii VEG]|eukprot:XP_002367167.1 ribosomal RNA (adenine(1779)-N(6)/adenine(1780)-N(6))-dimethyltransferase, putative [Toxoplasma gondii ME49]